MAAIRIGAREHHMGGMRIGRVLPYRHCRAVGPFVLLDHMGPVDAAVEVPPHPHIGLSTLTWLFEGRLRHRDSLGNDQWIYPGDVNWMTAGQGIVHSERSPHGAIHGLQCWVAQHRDFQQGAPSFQHIDARDLRRFSTDGIDWTLIAGHWFEQRSPLTIDWPTVFVEGRIQAPERWHWPYPPGWAMAVYVVSGELTIDSIDRERLHVVAGELVAFPANDIHRTSEPAIRDVEGAPGTHFVCLGGEPFPEERFFDWNFVSSEKALLAQARTDWIAGRFPAVPGDDGRIPHPAEFSRKE